MYRFRFNGTDKINQYEELIKVFMQPSEYEVIRDHEAEADYEYDFDGDKDEIKRSLYRDLQALTGKSPKWGILTGIRPVKLAAELDKAYDKNPSDVLQSRYFLHESKASLTEEILRFQQEHTGTPAIDSLSVYIGIPFCPTRCLYCSFTSNQVGDEEIRRYLEALKEEIRACGELIRTKGYRIESLYFGGGTPTTLTSDQLNDLLDLTGDSFDLGELKEFTVEAGRPDTIDDEKIEVLLAHGVDRISINPQSMKASTLELIGRRHTVEDVYRAFETALKYGVPSINADLIAGLPEETHEDFMNSVHEVIKLGADNVTLHTLAVKRASRLKEMDEHFNYKDELLREKMLKDAHAALRTAGFRPYYLYRQKHTSGNTENTGFCKTNPSVYNIRIMEEEQTILALGAGGISKVYYPPENRLERIANVSNYQIYIERISEMIQRKRTGGILNVNERT
ncbi:MAG: coproporphyrinogen dehydrogenase HemZ [Bacillota bacterium]|nr:coproporphyrinogen dehydrogenase HemZ [Bacillota bacterium]